MSRVEGIDPTVHSLKQMVKRAMVIALSGFFGSALVLLGGLL